MSSGQVTSNSSVEVGFVSRLAENPVATNGHAASKAKRPRGTQHVAHVCLGKKRAESFQSKRRTLSSRHGTASSCGLRSEEQYSSSGPGEECEPRQTTGRTTWDLRNCAAHEPLPTWPRRTGKVSLLKPPSLILPLSSHAGWHMRKREGWWGGRGWGNREPHAHKPCARWQSALPHPARG